MACLILCVLLFYSLSQCLLCPLCIELIHSVLKYPVVERLNLILTDNENGGLHHSMDVRKKEQDSNEIKQIFFFCVCACLNSKQKDFHFHQQQQTQLLQLVNTNQYGTSKL